MNVTANPQLAITELNKQISIFKTALRIKTFGLLVLLITGTICAALGMWQYSAAIFLVGFGLAFLGSPLIDVVHIQWRQENINMIAKLELIQNMLNNKPSPKRED